MRANRVELAGRLAETHGLRHTPSGLPSLQLRIAHLSRQQEAGRERQVECEAQALAFGAVASALAKLAPGTKVQLAGFLDRRNARDAQPVPHVIAFELLEE